MPVLAGILYRAEGGCGGACPGTASQVDGRMEFEYPVAHPHAKRLEQLSPFEIKNELIAMAEENARTSSATFLNAGRGNPNWIESDARGI